MIARWTAHPGLYWTVVVLTAAFFLLQDGFFTLDGWAHDASARWMLALLRGDPTMASFVRWHPFPVPNWMGHAWLALLGSILPPLLAEKALWASTILLFGIGCHRFAKAWAGPPNILLVGMVPLFLSGPFILGFYNFLIGLGLALWGAGYWVARTRGSWRNAPAFLVISLVVYSAHGSALLLFLLFCWSTDAWTVFVERTANVRSLLFLALLSLPSLALLAAFNAGQPNDWSDPVDRAPLGDLLHLRALLFYDERREAPQLLLIGVALLLGVGAAAYRLVAQRPVDPGQRRPRLFALLGTALLAAYFIFPDSSGYASYISMRLCVVGLMMWMLWPATALPTRPMLALPAVLLTLALGLRMAMILRGNEERRELRDAVLAGAAHLRPQGVVLPMLRDDDWIHGHLPSLLAVGQDIRLLDNYECTKGYFPLLWHTDLPDAFRRQVEYRGGCQAAMIAHMRGHEGPPVDHIVLLFGRKGADTTDCAVRDLLRFCGEGRYERTFTNVHVTVFTRKDDPSAGA